MAEQEWLECDDPQMMLKFLRGKVSERKLRLLAVACCRRIWNLLTHERSRKAVETAERVADGMAGPTDLAPFWVEHDDLPLSDEEIPSYAATYVARESAWSAATGVPANAASEEAWAVAPSRFLDWRRNEVRQAAERVQAVFLRCIFGNPFHPATITSTWLTPTVLSLAQAAYDNRRLPAGTLDNTRLAILADALEEAGCDNEDILNHCRQPGPHVRGCWVVDLVVGKE